MYLNVFLPHETAEDDANQAVTGTDADFTDTGAQRHNALGQHWDEYEFSGDPADLEIVRARLGLGG